MWLYLLFGFIVTISLSTRFISRKDYGEIAKWLSNVVLTIWFSSVGGLLVSAIMLCR